MTAIKLHMSSEELEARYESASDPIEKSHFHAVWLLSLGYAVNEVAELLSFSTRWVHQLIKRYNEGGPERLGDQRAQNRRSSRPRRSRHSNSGSSRRRTTVAFGRGPRLRAGWRTFMVANSCMTSAAGMG